MTTQTSTKKTDLEIYDILLPRVLSRNDYQLQYDGRYPSHSRFNLYHCGYVGRAVSESQVYRLQDNGYIDGNYKPTSKAKEHIK